MIRTESFDRSTFWVVTVVSDPIRYKSRYRLYRKFSKHMQDSGVNLLTVECQNGDRPFCVTEAGNPNHVQLRTYDTLWIKENLINIGVSKLPNNWRSVAWIDCDIEFVQKNWSPECHHLEAHHEDHDWVTELLHLLQIYDIVQGFQTCADLGPNNEILQVHKSLMSQYFHNRCNFPENKCNHYSDYHPGYIWCCTRRAWNAFGGLLDRCIAGASDRHMGMSFLGMGHKSFHQAIHQDYKKYIMAFQNRCEKNIRRNVGYLPGSIVHYFHGAKRNRFYQDRWQILVKNSFSPFMDLCYDSFGVLQLVDDGSTRIRRLRDDLRLYMMSRQEDGIDI